MSASSANVPHVPVEDRFTVDHLGHEDDRIQHLSVRFGFSDEPNLPEALRQAREAGAARAPASIDVDERVVLPVPRARSGARRRHGHGAVAQGRCSSASPTTRPTRRPTSGCPVDRTVTMGSPVDI